MVEPLDDRVEQLLGALTDWADGGEVDFSANTLLVPKRALRTIDPELDTDTLLEHGVLQQRRSDSSCVVVPKRILRRLINRQACKTNGFMNQSDACTSVSIRLAATLSPALRQNNGKPLKHSQVKQLPTPGSPLPFKRKRAIETEYTKNGHKKKPEALSPHQFPSTIPARAELEEGLQPSSVRTQLDETAFPCSHCNTDQLQNTLNVDAKETNDQLSITNSHEGMTAPLRRSVPELEIVTTTSKHLEGKNDQSQYTETSCTVAEASFSKANICNTTTEKDVSPVICQLSSTSCTNTSTGDLREISDVSTVCAVQFHDTINHGQITCEKKLLPHSSLGAHDKKSVKKEVSPTIPELNPSILPDQPKYPQVVLRLIVIGDSINTSVKVNHDDNLIDETPADRASEVDGKDTNNKHFAPDVDKNFAREDILPAAAQFNQEEIRTDGKSVACRDQKNILHNQNFGRQSALREISNHVKPIKNGAPHSETIHLLEAKRNTSIEDEESIGAPEPIMISAEELEGVATQPYCTDNTPNLSTIFKEKFPVGKFAHMHTSLEKAKPDPFNLLDNMSDNLALLPEDGSKSNTIGHNVGLMERTVKAHNIQISTPRMCIVEEVSPSFGVILPCMKEDSDTNSVSTVPEQQLPQILDTENKEAIGKEIELNIHGLSVRGHDLPEDSPEDNPSNFLEPENCAFSTFGEIFGETH